MSKLPSKALSTIDDTDLVWTKANRERARAQALSAMSSAGSLVYAVRTPGGLIKIGCSADMATRRRHLRAEVLALKFGDFDDETALHRELARHRAKGREYYHPHPDVLTVVNEMRSDLGLDPIE